MPDKGTDPPIHSNSSIGTPDGEVFVRPVLDEEIVRGVELAAEHLHEAAASEDALRRVRDRNPDSLWGIFRRGATNDAPPTMIGFCTFLIFNAKGAAALLRRELDLHRVDLDCLAPDPDTAEILYVWGILARGVSGAIVSIINDVMVRRYQGRPLYATAGTEAGLKFMRKSGYVPVFADSAGLGALHRRVGARVDLPPPEKRSRRVLTVVPVSTAEEFEKALAIRHVFLSEQNCPYEEEFDGNDRMGTLFLGYVDGEPAATLRVRYFADFFKMERLAVLPRFRRTFIHKEIVLAAVNFCRRKGYTRGFGHAQKNLVRFWEKFGFKRTGRKCILTFSGYEYVEMYGDLAPHDRALTMDTDPYVMIRPEGRWDEVSVLERSAGRPVVNPS